MRAFKIQHNDIYLSGIWVWIAYEDEEGKVNDEIIYHYVRRDEINLDDVKIGDTLYLDEPFLVLNVDRIEDFHYHVDF